MMKVIKTVVYNLGLLSVYHRWRNRRNLTVVMFHRVLAKTDSRWASADPEWTITDTFLEDCLAFFRKHYHVIGIDELLRACQDQSPLPNRALLITFDDGWSDNEEYALRQLQRAEVPAVVFAVADAIDRNELWPEAILRAWKLGRLSPEDCELLWRRVDNTEQMPESWDNRAVRLLVNRLGAGLDPEKLREILAPLLARAAEPHGPEMLSSRQLQVLARQGVFIGSHGLTHLPIPKTKEPWTELATSRQKLAALLADPTHKGLLCLSFPHSAHDGDTIRSAFAAGYKLLFGGGFRLNPLTRDHLRNRFFHRVHISEECYTDTRGRLAPASLAAFLFRLPSAQIVCQ